MSVLRPRDIQARIRSGESPEAVAAVAQTTVEKIMAFATPVLAERAYVAQQAQRASVRRRSGDGPIGHLGEAVSTRLTAEEVAADDVAWDAWRREDGRWALVAEYAVGGDQRRARFVFDTAGRYVVPEDDEARRLVGERAAGSVPTGPAKDPSGDRPGDPTVPPAGEQMGLGDDAIALVTGRRPDPAGPPESPAPADWMATQASDRPAHPPRPVAVPQPEALFEAAALAPAADEPAGTDEPTRAAAGPDQRDHQPDEQLDQPSRQPGVQEEPAAEDRPAEPPKSRRSGRTKGRASVPSWDEIMFGSGRNAD